MSSIIRLHHAIRQGNLELAKKLLENKASVLSTDSDKNTSLHVLIERFVESLEDKPDVLSMIDKLLMSGVDVNTKNINGSTALHMACWRFCDTVEVVDKLLDWGADINLKNNDKETPFEIAFRSKPQPQHSDFLKLYHHVQKLNDLSLKLDTKNIKLCKMILKKTEVWKNETDWPFVEKMFSDHELCVRQQERLDEIEKLKEVVLKDQVSLYDYLKMDAKQAAHYSSNKMINKMIHENEFKNLYKNFGYLISVTHRKGKQWLEAQEHNKNKAKVDVMNVKSASKANKSKGITVSTLSEEPMANQKVSHEESLLEVIKTGNGELVKKLLDGGASIEITDANDNTPLHLAFSLKRMKMVDLILARMTSNSNYVNLKNRYGLSHLHIACARGDASIVQSFIDAKVNVKEVVNKDAPEYAGFSALHFSCHFKNLETVKTLSRTMNLFGSAKSDGTAFSDEQKSHIIRGYCTMVIKFSISTKENPLSDFHLACFSDSYKVVKRFLQRKAVNVNVNLVMSDDTKYTPRYTALHFAVDGSKDRQEKVKLLLQHGADANLMNSQCMTPVHLAMYNDTTQVKHNYLTNYPKEDKCLELLYEAAKDKESNPMDAFGLTYLHIAVAVGDESTVKKMLFRGERVNHAVLENRRGFPRYTALHFAALYGRAEIAKLLIGRGADVEGNVHDDQFETPLQVAIDHGHREVIDLLLQNGADAKVMRASEHETTIHLLVERFKEMDITGRVLSREETRDEKAELVWCIEKLASLGVDVDAKKKSNGNTALHSICESIDGCYRCVEWLLAAGADINVKNAEGDTPLDLVGWSKARGNYDDYIKLYHHVQKLQDLGLKVDPRNETFCEMVLIKKKIWMHHSDWAPVKEMFSNETLARKKRERHDEIEALHRDMLDANVSLYDYLKMTPEAAAMFATNERLKKIIDDDQYRALYPIYGYLVTVQQRKGLKWLADNGKENGKKPGKKSRRAKRKAT